MKDFIHISAPKGNFPSYAYLYKFSESLTMFPSEMVNRNFNIVDFTFLL